MLQCQLVSEKKSKNKKHTAGCLLSLLALTAWRQIKTLLVAPSAFFRHQNFIVGEAINNTALQQETFSEFLSSVLWWSSKLIPSCMENNFPFNKQQNKWTNKKLTGEKKKKSLYIICIKSFSRFTHLIQYCFHLLFQLPHTLFPHNDQSPNILFPSMLTRSKHWKRCRYDFCTYKHF